ncbi:uncharacterized protein LOC131953519 [Physella acuta]|uniref:uncharacterized protein LOC131953519 n=1 Tax=Physella acuta TaxID=109671 RepID=UPI0027DB82FB|nr:uncharacterized protein LOC131953519 [Physella acuta]
MDSDVHIVRAILRQNEFLLRRHLVLSKTVLDNLRTTGLITDVTRRKILLEPAHKQVPVLLGCLENKGIPSLRKFLEVLRNTGHGWMVEHILDTDISMGGGKGRSTDDIGYRDRHQPTFTRPHPQIADYFSKRTRLDVARPDNRKSVTAGLGYQPDAGMSLGSLLKAREPVDMPETATRGIINARTLFADPMAGGVYPSQPGLLPGLPAYANHPVHYPRSREEIPITLYGLNQAFSDQDQKNQQALSVLQQEEVAIRQLMQQNARDQGNVRRKQAAVQDIVHRLKDIHNRAKDVYEPSPNPNIGRYRLAQLNQIPWSIDN